jgi:hypothetical protein
MTLDARFVEDRRDIFGERRCSVGSQRRGRQEEQQAENQLSHNCSILTDGLAQSRDLVIWSVGHLR